MKNRIYALSVLILSILALSCGKEDPINNTVPTNLVSAQSNEIIVSWNNLFLEVERYAGGYRPGPAPRAIALIGLANYEACIEGMPDYKSVAGLYPGLSIPKPESGIKYNWPTVINAIYAQMMTEFFPNVPKDKFDKIAALESSRSTFYSQQLNVEKSRAYGKAVAQAVWEWSKTDAVAHDAYKDPFGTYSWQDKFKKDGDWVPPVAGAKPMFSNWGKARTFAISEADKLCIAPIPYSTDKNSAYYTQGLEVFVESSKATQSVEGKWIGEFWSDDLINVTFSPGPRWLAIANQAIVNEKSNLETAIFTNVKVGMALNDAAVACWHSKYYYNVERPNTYLRKVFDPNYKSALDNPLTGDKGITPSFPAYPSGHSTMGAAAAEALSSIFGYNYAMTDKCHEGRTDFVGTPRSFNSFYEMAEENAISRVPLGVHWRMDCEQGVNLGYKCGRKVNKIAFKK
jgi:membrane-associated phospholipid phosphatase